jgi:hypothetical protein
VALRFCDSACWLWTRFFQKKFPFNNLRTTEIRRAARAFGREPNALPKLLNCLIRKNFGSPGRVTSLMQCLSRFEHFLRHRPDPEVFR